jgi:C4-dicarboxylate-specific signal transduction histidine kinase
MQSLVNERKKIEDALRASNDRLEETVNKCKIVEEKLREYNVELGELVKERTAELLKANEKLKLEIEIKSKTENELRSKINELEKFYEMSVGRELKMKELTEENEKLKSELLKYKM